LGFLHQRLIGTIAHLSGIFSILRTGDGSAILSVRVNLLCIDPVFLCDDFAKGTFKAYIYLIQVGNRNSHREGFLNFIAIRIGNGAGAFLVADKAIGKGSVIRSAHPQIFSAKIQRIKNGLHAGAVDTAAFDDGCNLRHCIIQVGKAAPHILDVLPVLRWHLRGDATAVKGEIHSGVVVVCGTGQQAHDHDND